MATLPLDQHIQWRGGSTAAINKYAGVAREFVLDTTKNTIVLLSGTAGTNYPMAKEDRTITAGAGIKMVVDGSEASSASLAKDFTVKANLADVIAANNGLKANAEGKLELDFTMTYTAATGKVAVLAADGTTELNSITIPSHTSSLASATLEVASAGSPVNGQVTGTYIHQVYNLTNGSTSDVYIDVTSLIDVYTAGAGLQVNASDDHKFEVKAGNGIEATVAGGVAVKLKTGEDLLKVTSAGLELDKTALAAETAVTVVSADTGNVLSAGTDTGAFLKIDTACGLSMGANGLTLPLDMGVISE